MKYFFGNPAVLALASLVGTIVGAGIFALPYAVSQSGAIPAIFYFVVMGGVVLLLHLFFGEFSLRTSATHRLIGYAKLYLGSTGKGFAVFAILFSNIGALLAYTIIGGEFLQTALSPLVAISSFQASLIFWGILSLFILRGIKLIAKAELLMNIALFAAVGIIFFFAIPFVHAENFFVFSMPNAFLPYGLILFAFAGWSAIPEIAELFKKKKD
ncbi:MAG: amino acid permease, partial [Candidatus Wildermuthbacteria bacterium]|nr:amino acid permease [Candidatus Wildermuthbacteria bacterium]